MLIGENKMMSTAHVKFVSYTGKYPNLCNGLLTLKIEGEECRFAAYDPNAEYDKFWFSGGSTSWDNYSCGEWNIDVSLIPEKFRKYASEIDYVFNKNVEYGCCGGCI